LNYSSSADSVVLILYKLKNEWENFQWPNEDEKERLTKALSIKILSFSQLFYDNLQFAICNKFEEFEMPLDNEQHLNSICAAMNNINHVSQKVQKLNLNFTEIEMAEKTLEPADHKKSDLVELSIERMKPLMKTLIEEDADETEISNIHKFDDYINSIRQTLIDNLNNSDLELMRSSLEKVFFEVLNELSHLENKPETFYSNINDFLNSNLFVNSAGYEFSDKTIRKNIKRQLDFHLMTSQKCIHHYFVERYEMQSANCQSQAPVETCGKLGINCYFQHDELSIEILNFKLDTKHKKDFKAYVKISVVPEELFTSFQNKTTNFEVENCCSIIEQRFSL
jgi:hypothetical protein